MPTESPVLRAVEKHYDALSAFFVDNDSVVRALYGEFLGIRDFVEECPDLQQVWVDIEHRLSQHPDQILVLCQYLPSSLSEKVLLGQLSIMCVCVCVCVCVCTCISV